MSLRESIGKVLMREGALTIKPNGHTAQAKPPRGVRVERELDVGYFFQ